MSRVICSFALVTAVGLSLSSLAAAAFTDVTPDAATGMGRTQGVCWGDYDNDGDLDCYLTDWDLPNRLLRNDDGLSFSEVAEGTPLANHGSDRGAAWADYDNDGDLDLYLANQGTANRLFRNDGAGAFVDATAGPLGNEGGGVGVLWGDYDNDGNVDLYLGNWTHANRLLRNLGDGSFEDVTPGPLAISISDGGAWGDYDGDGDLDLYVCVHGSNVLLRNDPGGGFIDVTNGPLGNSDGSEGADWGDYDNDGDLDLYFAAEFSVGALLRNDGADSFADVTNGPLGAAASYAAAWGDYDDDSDLDLLVTDTRLMRNDGESSFADVTGGQLPGAVGGLGAAWADYDNDGDLDLMIAGGAGAPNRLYRNDVLNGHHWLQLDLVGGLSNAAGIGARVRIVAQGLAQTRQVEGGSGFCSENALRVHFGSGASAIIDTLEVAWPSGVSDTRTDVPADARLTIAEGIQVPLNAPTIQAGINMAVEGVTVTVAPGTYTGEGNRDLDFGGRNISLRSEAGAEVTTIDCENMTRAFHFHNGETGEAVVDGFTIRGGAAFDGAAVRCEDSSPAFVHCVFTDNGAISLGGAVSVAGSSSPTFASCEFLGNRAAAGGAMIISESSSVTLQSCALYDNAAGNGGGIAVWPTASLSMQNSIIAFSEQGPAVFCTEAGSAILTCCDIYGNAGGDWVGCIADQQGTSGNFAGDPLFCNPALGNLSLHEDSPCAPDQSPADCGLIGARPVGCGTTGVTLSDPPRIRRRLSILRNPVLSRAEFVVEGFTAADKLEIYDPMGRLVERLVPSGSLAWAPSGREPSGFYFARLVGQGSSQVVKFVVVR